MCRDGRSSKGAGPEPRPSTREDTVITDANPTTGPTDDRAAAVKRLQAKRDFATHLVTYLVINAGLVLIWFVTGHGYFWPGWVLGGWAIGVALHAWEVYGRRAISEEDIVHEMNRRRGGGR